MSKRVSVVICTYKLSNYEHLQEAIESVLDQDYENTEVIVIVDGNNKLHDKISKEYSSFEKFLLHNNESNQGLSQSRNTGVNISTGEIIAFLDDDAVAEETWIEELVRTYRRRDALAVGGKMVPQWIAGKPDYLPAEFYWLVGVTHRGFPTEEREVRNTFGSNISFKRTVFQSIGGFDADLGRHGGRQIQGEETEFAARMYTAFGERVWYNPAAVVEHKVFQYRTDPVWLTKRAFWQGYSKRVLDDINEDSGGEETEFLTQLFFEGLPRYARQTVQNHSASSLIKGLFAIMLTISVGTGYLYALLSANRLNQTG
jgi:glycosyltransferase involved in cell wall biosynthesis